MLSYLGRREEALTAAREAEELYRALAQSRPDAFTPNLAGSLNNLAIRLSGLGRREEALAAAQEAVGALPRPCASRPDAFTPDLAGSLNNLATALRPLGGGRRRWRRHRKRLIFTGHCAVAPRCVHARSGHVAQQSGERLSEPLGRGKRRWRRHRKRLTFARALRRRAPMRSRPIWPCRSTIWRAV